MKIIAGERRGHKFEGPPSRGVRPTSDLVREAIFNILREEVEDRLVVDLFAGTGSFGLEALSRGARRVIFVERNRETAALVRKNVGTLRYEDRATIVNADALRWVHGFRAGDEPVIVFLDPPFADFEVRAKRMGQFLGELVGKLPGGSVLLFESRRPLPDDILPDPDQWEIRRYGSTTLTIRRIPDGTAVEATDETGSVLIEDEVDEDGEDV
jgi:16S rRNA (guanine(966)-N(2))-methyltransferase RsmD